MDYEILSYEENIYAKKFLIVQDMIERRLDKLAEVHGLLRWQNSKCWDKARGGVRGQGVRVPDVFDYYMDNTRNLDQEEKMKWLSDQIGDNHEEFMAAFRSVFFFHNTGVSAPAKTFIPITEQKVYSWLDVEYEAAIIQYMPDSEANYLPFRFVEEPVVETQYRRAA